MVTAIAMKPTFRAVLEFVMSDIDPELLEKEPASNRGSLCLPRTYTNT